MEGDRDMLRTLLISSYLQAPVDNFLILQPIKIKKDNYFTRDALPAVYEDEREDPAAFGQSFAKRRNCQLYLSIIRDLTFRI